MTFRLCVVVPLSAFAGAAIGRQFGYSVIGALVASAIASLALAIEAIIKHKFGHGQ